MREYEKIETPFKRDMNGTKKLIEGDFRNDSIAFLKNNEWMWTEKIDGTNTRVIWDGHNVSFAGHIDRAQLPNTLIAKLNELFGGNTNEEIFEQEFGEKQVILYGEGYGAGIQKGGAYRKDVSFILFDVNIDGTYLSRQNIEDIAKAFNIDVVPIIFNGTVNKAVEYVKTKPQSTIGTAKMEGLVGKPLVELTDRRGKRIITKVKVRDFE